MEKPIRTIVNLHWPWRASRRGARPTRWVYSHEGPIRRMKHGYILTKDQSEQSLTCTLCPQPDGTLLVVGNAARLGETARAHTLAAQLDRAPGTPTRQVSTSAGSNFHTDPQTRCACESRE
eukprot:3354377-Pyramimonas_sp.AAC.2